MFGATEIVDFLNHLAKGENVSAAKQNQALSSPRPESDSFCCAFAPQNRRTHATPVSSLTFGCPCCADEPYGLPCHPQSHSSRLRTPGHTSEQRGPAPHFIAA